MWPWTRRGSGQPSTATVSTWPAACSTARPSASSSRTSIASSLSWPRPPRTSTRLGLRPTGAAISPGRAAHPQRAELLAEVVTGTPRSPLPRCRRGDPWTGHRPAPHQAVPEATRRRIAVPDAPGLALLPDVWRPDDRGDHPRVTGDRRDGLCFRVSRQPPTRASSVDVRTIEVR